MDVLIVGAGAAGLGAAVELIAAGMEVEVIEARTRTGGRVWTLQHDATPAPIELGAEFVHGDAVLTEQLAAAAGSLIVDVEGDQWRAQQGRLTKQNDFWPAVGRVMRRLDATREPDRSFGDFLRSRPGGTGLARARTLARSFVQGFHAADLDRISERSLAGGGNPGTDESAARHGRLTTGYGPLLAHHAASCSDRIRFGTVVQRIAWRRGGVTAHLAAADGGSLDTVEARAALIAVPLPALQSRALRLDPEPATVRAAVDRLIMGSVVRVTLVFRDRFWESDRLSRAASLERLSFLHTPHSPFNIWWTLHPMRAPVVIGWSGGPPARELARAGAVEGAALAALAAALGMQRRSLESRLAASFTHDWDADPFARGAYSYAGVGGAGAARRLARPIQQTLFLAGEATAGADSGTVEGALASGRRAARQLLRSR